MSEASTLISRPCVLVRGARADRDDFGLDDDPDAEEVRVETVCAIQQRQRTEDPEAGEVSRSDWTGYFLPDETLGTADKVEVDDERYEVVGEPWRVMDLETDEASHLEASLRRTAGALDEVAA